MTRTMHRCRFWLCAVVLTLGAAATGLAEDTVAEYRELLGDPDLMRGGGSSSLVRLQDDGRLTYGRDPDGNRICDFSYAGYRGGGGAIPDVPVALTLKPQDGDDTKRIQAAVDRLGSMSVNENGFRGALLLRRGKYTVSRTIHIRHSGVVIRGEGAGFGGTWIYHRRMDPIPDQSPGRYIHYPRPEKGMIPTFRTHGGRARTRKVADVTDPLVPAGSSRLHVTDTTGLSEGDEIVVVCRQTQRWVEALGLEEQWDADRFVLRFPRVVKEVSGNTGELVLNVPITSRIDRENGYARGEVHVVTKDTRLRKVGLEDVLLMSGYNRSKRSEKGYFIDEHHPNYAFRFYHVRDGWVRRCVGFFYSCGLVSTGGSQHLTVEDCAMLDGVSRDTPHHHVGTRKYYFNAQGPLLLFQRCYSRYARHAFTGNSTCGGVVFLDCFSEHDHLPSEWHQRWGYGHIFDNLSTEAPLSSIGIPGYPHGQRAAFAVHWNCFANNKRTWVPDVAVNAMPGIFRNYAIGAVHRGSGEIGASRQQDPMGELGIVESTNRFVEPRSLYLAQLRNRLGEDAVRNVATMKQIEAPHGTVWQNLIERFATLPEYADPEKAPWKGYDHWVPEFDQPVAE